MRAELKERMMLMELRVRERSRGRRAMHDRGDTATLPARAWPLLQPPVLPSSSSCALSPARRRRVRPLLGSEEKDERGAACRPPPVRFHAAPSLESVLLDYVYPSEAAPLMAALASDPNLPALRSVGLIVSPDGNRLRPFPGPLAPVAEAMRRALEQRAGGAAAGATLGEWRVEVEEFEPGEEEEVRDPRISSAIASGQTIARESFGTALACTKSIVNPR